MLVVRQRGAAIISSSDAGPQIKALWKGVGRACDWRRPRAPTARTLFQDERATPVVSTFLWETKVGGMVLLVAVGGGSGTRTEHLVEVEGEEGGPEPP